MVLPKYPDDEGSHLYYPSISFLQRQQVATIKHRQLGSVGINLDEQRQNEDEVMTQYGVVFVTAGSEQEAGVIAQTLVDAKLAACVSIMPIQSVYTWQGKVHQDQEWQLMIKTDLAQFPNLETKIRAIHSYELPEIIALPIMQGSQPYLDWIGEQVNSDCSPQ